MNEKSNQEFRNASGRIPYHMTNDYLFRAVLQSNNKALRDWYVLCCICLKRRYILSK